MAFQWVFLANLTGPTGNWFRTPLANATNLDTVTTPGAHQIVTFSSSSSMTPALPALGAGIFEVLPVDANVVQRWTTLDNPHQTWGRVRNAGAWGAWRIQSWEKAALPSGQNFDTVKEPGEYAFWGTAGPNNPTAGPGRLTVSPKIFQNGAWTYHTQTWQSFEPIPRIFIRSTSATAWQPWREVGPAVSADTVSAAAMAPSVLQDVYRRRRGGTLGTAGKAAVCLRFDHGLNNFKATILPLLRARGLPAALALNSGIYTTANALTESDQTTWADIESWCLNDGMEVWNHGETHRDAATSATLKVELVDSLTALRASLPKQAIEGFILPGVSGTKFGGLNDIISPDVLYSTEAGRLLLSSHAVVTGQNPGIVMPLDGQIKQGMAYRNMDTAAGVDAGIAMVADAQASGSGVVLMLHPSLLDGSGQTTTAKLTQLLDLLVTERDAGRLEITTHSGLMIASADSAYRNNILGAVTPGASVSKSVDLTKFGHLKGAVRKLVATVTVTASASVTVSLADAGTGLNATRTVTGLAPGTYEVSQHGTLPLTAATVTAAATVNTGSASITALKLINV